MFKDPHDFLSILDSNFNVLSGRKDAITFSDLQTQAHNPELEPKVRAAASLAFEHFDDIAGIGAHMFSRKEPSDKITFSDISFAENLNDHSFDPMGKEFIGAVIGGLGFGSASAMLGSVGCTEITGSLVGLGSAGFGVGMLTGGTILLGLAALSVGAVAVETYKYNKLSEQDAEMFRSWMK